MDKSKVPFISNDFQVPFPVVVLDKFNHYNVPILETLMETALHIKGSFSLRIS